MRADRRPPFTGTYRLQLRPGFGFDEAAEIAGYLASLGVSHAYLSPVLQAASGSEHGYDVIDHSSLSADLGGDDGFDRMVEVLDSQGLGVVVDVVPNHMAVPTPASLNAPLWSVLRDGPLSPFARWFDVDWSTPDRAVLMPVLGRRLGLCLRDGEIVLDTSGREPLLRYYEHAFPVRPGTEGLSLPELVDRQWYRLAYWRVADEELNYRRFFDVDTLAAVRVEDPAVFAETHARLLAAHERGQVDGFRIDHIDGLADPAGYLRSLANATGGSWVVVEKILMGDEALPADWACAGTTGYDALNRVLDVLVDPAGAEAMSATWMQFADSDLRDFAEVEDQAKREVIEHSLWAEVHRLSSLAAAICQDDVMLRDFTRRGLSEALIEVLAAMPVSRAYVVPGEEPAAQSVAALDRSAQHAVGRRPDRADEIELVRELALGRLGGGPGGRRAEFCVRFQQTCDPVMAKGVEDTAFYRYHRLVALNEVGGDPGRFGGQPDALHVWAGRMQSANPLGMTTISTHDAKRSEDVRARLAVLSEMPLEWREAVLRWQSAAAQYRSPDGWPDGPVEYLIWQTLVGAWPIDADRLGRYLEKATREAKVHTGWTSPDESYDGAVRSYGRAVLADADLSADIAALVAAIEPAYRSNALAQKLLQLTLPGVPDVYQGCEGEDLSLVDPDNRRPVPFARLAERLARLDAGEAPRDLTDEKLLVTSRALRLRREHPAWFGPEGGYEQVPTTSQHALAFIRAERVATVVTRLPVGLAGSGGWGEARAVLPEGDWLDVLTGARHAGAGCSVASLLERLPVALLVRR